MSAVIPKISVTAERNAGSIASSDDEDCLSNDMDYNMHSGNNTDVEDFDSQITNIKSISPVNINCPDTLNLAHRLDLDNDVTDEEDYNMDMDNSEELISNVYPELKISLQEFLQYGDHERISTNNEAHGNVEIKAGNFLLAQHLNGLNDYLTDCEDYNTDSEVEDCFEKSVCVDLENVMGEPSNVCIKDDGANDEDDENISYVSDISDLASAISDIGESDLLNVSGKEEICLICYSGSSSEAGASDLSAKEGNCELPSIDVTFVSTRTNKDNARAAPSSLRNLLPIQNPQEEVLTDIEPIDSAAEEGSFDNEENEEPIPQAIILAVDDDGTCQTDIEEMPCEENLVNVEEKCVAEQVIPTPHREVIELREDKFGDTTTNVMPMSTDFSFGIYNDFKDDCATDSEDFSTTEDLKLRIEDAMSEPPEIPPSLTESDVITSNEVLKPGVKKRTELHTSNESVTDVEEIYIAGTTRRKKLKTRSMSKSKSKFLDVERSPEASCTDAEDIELSDRSPIEGVNKCANNQQSNLESENDEVNPTNNIEMVTDVEDISAEENCAALEMCHPDINNSSFSEYLESSANIVITKEMDPNQKISTDFIAPNCRMFPFPSHHVDEDDNLHQALTDNEDIQLPSDAEDLAYDIPNSNISCEISELLNESCTVVHEKSGNNFNVEVEKLNIKGMTEIRDANTDTEYFELDEPEIPKN